MSNDRRDPKEIRQDLVDRIRDLACNDEEVAGYINELIQYNPDLANLDAHNKGNDISVMWCAAEWAIISEIVK